jgi:hypothetical protein
MISEPAPSKPRPQARPWQRWWFWTVIGLGVLGGVGAAVLSSESSPSAPMTDLGSKRFF